jgi:hypothetical protein
MFKWYDDVPSKKRATRFFRVRLVIVVDELSLSIRHNLGDVRLLDFIPKTCFNRCPVFVSMHDSASCLQTAVVTLS